MTMPRLKTDPANRGSHRKRGAKAIKRRLKAARSEIVKMFRNIPKKRSSERAVLNSEHETVYEYDYDAALLSASVAATLDRLLLETPNKTPPPRWFFTIEMEVSYRDGSMSESRDINSNARRAMAAGIDIGVENFNLPEPVQVTQTSQYAKRFQKELVRSFDSMVNLSTVTSTQAYRQIAAGMDAGLRPADIVAKIDERFDVADSSAVRIANTELQTAYNDAKLDVSDYYGTTTGLQSGVIHVSALIPTTRPDHAARHGNAYTVTAQRRWWDSGSNRINCYCSTIPVLLTANGKLIRTDEMKEIEAERGFLDVQ